MGLYKLGQAGLAGSSSATINLPANAATDYDYFLILLRAAGSTATFELQLNSHTVYYSTYNRIIGGAITQINDTSPTTKVNLGITLSSNTALANCVIEIHNPNGANSADVSGLWQWGVNDTVSNAQNRFGGFNAYGLASAVTSIGIYMTNNPTYGIFYVYGAKSDG